MHVVEKVNTSEKHISYFVHVEAGEYYYEYYANNWTCRVVDQMHYHKAKKSKKVIFETCFGDEYYVDDLFLSKLFAADIIDKILFGLGLNLSFHVFLKVDIRLCHLDMRFVVLRPFYLGISNVPRFIGLFYGLLHIL